MKHWEWCREPLTQLGATAEAGVVRGKVREGSSQKGTFSKQSGVGRTVQAEKRVWTKEERIKRVLFLRRMVHCGTPNRPLPSLLSLTRYRTDKDLVQDHSLCLHSQPPLTRAISPKGLSRAESDGTCRRIHRTHRPHQQLQGSSSERSPHPCPPWSSLGKPPRKHLREC